MSEFDDPSSEALAHIVCAAADELDREILDRAQPARSDVKPPAREVGKMAWAYCQKPGNEAGGALHIALDDYNLDDDSIRFCLQCAFQEKDADGAELAGLMLQLSQTQRRKVCGIRCRLEREDRERR